MKKIAALISLLSLLFVAGLLCTEEYGIASPQDDWKQEYATVCAKTQNAMDLSVDELNNYIDRCNMLQSRIHELNGPQGSETKVYSKRLKMCRDLYEFALQLKDIKE
jgi:hypothetical protein